MAEQRKNFFDACAQRALGLITDNQRELLSAFVKEQMAENANTLPGWPNGLVNI